MKADLLLSNLHLYDTPEKIELFKQSVLQLAVQGKLVPQDPDDEPASELIKKIKAEKEKLIKEGKIKKQKPLPPISEDEIPYELPDGWEWVRLGDVCEINPRNEANDELESSFIPMSLVSEIYGEIPQHEIKKWKEIKQSYTHFADNDVVVAKITPCFENSKAGIMRNLVNGIGAGTTELHVVRSNPSIIAPEYLYIYFKSPKFINEGISKMTGTAGHKRVPKQYISENPFPLPPINEQKRIVEKIDFVFEKADEIKSRLEKSDKVLIDLNKSSINRLLESKKTHEYQTNTQLLLQNFDLLYSDERNVKELKQAILQLAVQGKLVPQDPDDEPASELIKKINAEKEKLIKEGKIKKQKPLTAISENEIPYELPEGWMWTRLGEISNYGSTYKADNGSISVDTWVLYLEDIEKNTSKVLSKVKAKNRKFKSSSNLFNKGDVLYGKLRPYLNKVVVADEDGVCAGEIIPIKTGTNIDSNYLKITLMCPRFLAYVNSKTYGIKMPRLGTKDGRMALIPLPPLNEQKRIVKKVNDLLKICNLLESRITESKEKSDKLVNSILYNSVN